MIFEVQKFLLNTLRLFMNLLSYIFPIKDNRVLFTAFNGKQYSCNPKYIYLKLLELKLNGIDYIWVYNNPDKLHNTLKTVRFMSIKYIYYYLTSRIIVTNQGFKSFIPKSHGQVHIETWHGGGAYKKIDLDIIDDKFKRYKYYISGEDIDYYVSSCNAFSSCMSIAQCVAREKFLPVGMPRNDILINQKQRIATRERIRNLFGIGKEIKIILYAPTWRDNHKEVEVNNLLACLSVKQNIRLFYRAHHATVSSKLMNSVIINVSDYPDMQELLCAADILITDYSSCMWDFSLMYKPCFIYATDIEQYKQDRDFYTPMSEWPFPIATNTDELINNILNFDEKSYIEKVKQHHLALGSYEDGHACERICNLIEKIIEGKITEDKLPVKEV